MTIATTRLEEIKDAAQELADACDELIALREDSTSDREDKISANEEVDSTIRTLRKLLPKEDGFDG